MPTKRELENRRIETLDQMRETIELMCQEMHELRRKIDELISKSTKSKDSSRK